MHYFFFSQHVIGRVLQISKLRFRMYLSEGFQVGPVSESGGD